jgi:hypothetical protein
MKFANAAFLSTCTNTQHPPPGPYVETLCFIYICEDVQCVSGCWRASWGRDRVFDGLRARRAGNGIVPPMFSLSYCLYLTVPCFTCLSEKL